MTSKSSYTPKKAFALAMLCLLSVLRLTAEEIKVQVRDHGISHDSPNIAPRLHALITEFKGKMRQHDKLKLCFEPGQYHFRQEEAPQRELYISNHDQVGWRAVGILLEDMHDVSLEGQESEFVFHDRMLPIAIVRSSKVHISGIAIDFSEPQISQVEVLARQEGEEGLRFRPAPWVKWRIGAKSQFEAYGSNWHNSPSSGIVFNKKDYHTAYRISDLGYSTEGLVTLESGELYAPQWRDPRLKPGMVVAMRSYERPNPAVFVDASRDVSLRDCDVYYADGMGLLAQNTHNVTLRGFNVCRRGNGYLKTQTPSPRYFTTQADATHFSGCSGHISVSHGLFEHMMDDAINVHGVYLKLMKRIDDYTLEGQYMHSQAWGFEWGRVGDPVQFIYSQTFDSHKPLNRIVEISPVDKAEVKGAKRFRIRLARKLAEDIRPETSIGIENMRKLASVDFSYNTIRNNRARGALFNTPRPIKVHHNNFDHISGSGIVASTDCNQWFESGQTQYLHIWENVFNDVLTSLYQFTEAVITLHPVVPKIEEQRVPFYGTGKKGIIIERNLFRTFDTPLLYAKSVKGLLWRDNRIETTNTYPQYHWNQERYKLISTQDINIKD